MSFEDRLRGSMQTHAERAETSPDAYDRILERAERPHRPWLAPALAMGSAAAVVALALAFVGGDDADNADNVIAGPPALATSTTSAATGQSPAAADEGSSVDLAATNVAGDGMHAECRAHPTEGPEADWVLRAEMARRAESGERFEFAVPGEGDLELVPTDFLVVGDLARGDGLAEVCTRTYWAVPPGASGDGIGWTEDVVRIEADADDWTVTGWTIGTWHDLGEVRSVEVAALESLETCGYEDDQWTTTPGGIVTTHDDPLEIAAMTLVTGGLGPGDEPAYGIPADTRVLSVEFHEGVVTVDFSAAVAKTMTTSCDGSYKVRLIERTFLNQPGVRTVRILVDGDVPGDADGPHLIG